METRMEPPESVSATVSAPANSAEQSSLHGRFLPGSIFGGRYRIIELLGRGGMGEVYRADDLELGQPVALKFIPGSIGNDAELARLRREVRLARQLSHPNICRVFDIGHAEDQYFLTMEYIDGEDLASVLRRMGRPSKPKAIQIARQICAALAAAHDAGVLHRDLKPANIMIDGRGRVRIMDFGLSALITEVAARAEFAGTPVYMAPEQLAAGGLSTRTDIYSLGLVLYELLTGVKPFSAANIGDLRELHWLRAEPSPLSRHVPDIEPNIESVVLRCLEPDPGARPASVAEVAVAFPGRDPVSEAIAAGETPSPEAIAAAGGEGTLPPATACLLLAAIVVALGGCVSLAKYSTVVGLAGFEKSPEVLVDRSRAIIRDAGYGSLPVADSAFSVFSNYRYLSYLARREDSRAWRRAMGTAEAGAVRFWYRQSPQPLQPYNRASIVTGEDPPASLPGMAYVLLDGHGLLRTFITVPKDFEQAEGSSVQPQWETLFAAADLDEKKMTAAAPVWNPPVAFDSRFSWDGTKAGTPVHVDAAAFHGRPVYFDVNGPWAAPSVDRTDRFAWLALVREGTYVAGALLLLIVGLILARRNARQRRGNPVGAMRLCAFFFSISIMHWAMKGHLHVQPGRFWEALIGGVGDALFTVAFIWIAYMAVEPYARRYWPDQLISWTRLGEARLRDPLVGRDVLIAVLGGSVIAVLVHLSFALPAWLAVPNMTPIGISSFAMGTPLQAVGIVLGHLKNGVVSALATTLILVLANLVLRNRWAAIVATGLIFAGTSLGTEYPRIQITLGIVLAVAFLLILLRVGVLALVVAVFCSGVLVEFPLTLDSSCWYIGRSLFALASVTAIALYAFGNAVGRRKVVSWVLRED